MTETRQQRRTSGHGERSPAFAEHDRIPAPRSGSPAPHAEPASSSRRLPNALGAWNEIEGRLRGRQAFVALDYDGTLTPIVARPEHATLSYPMREVLTELAHTWPTAIISGRARADVERLVGIGSIYYAGSHGFDISGPGGLRLSVASAMMPVLFDAAAELRQRLTAVPGILIENKLYSVAVHHRRVEHAHLATINAAIGEVLGARPGLRRTVGKKVLELSPAVEWDKGRALRWLMRELGLERSGAVPVYIGDDRTDEDAFRAVSPEGIGILVSTVPWSSSAAFSVGDVPEVRHLLWRLIGLGHPG